MIPESTDEEMNQEALASQGECQSLYDVNDDVDFQRDCQEPPLGNEEKGSCYDDDDCWGGWSSPPYEDDDRDFLTSKPFGRSPKIRFPLGSEFKIGKEKRYVTFIYRFENKPNEWHYILGDSTYKKAKVYHKPFLENVSFDHWIRKDNGLPDWGSGVMLDYLSNQEMIQLSQGKYKAPGLDRPFEMGY